MYAFYLDKKSPLKSFQEHIEREEKHIPEIKANHSLGRHGSDKGECCYCKSMTVHEHCKCEKGTEENKEKWREHIEKMKEVKRILELLTLKEQKSLFEYLKF